MLFLGGFGGKWLNTIAGCLGCQARFIGSWERLRSNPAADLWVGWWVGQSLLPTLWDVQVGVKLRNFLHQNARCCLFSLLAAVTTCCSTTRRVQTCPCRQQPGQQAGTRVWPFSALSSKNESRCGQGPTSGSHWSTTHPPPPLWTSFGKFSFQASATHHHIIASVCFYGARNSSWSLCTQTRLFGQGHPHIITGLKPCASSNTKITASALPHPMANTCSKQYCGMKCHQKVRLKSPHNHNNKTLKRPQNS